MRKIRETLTLSIVFLWSASLSAQQRGEISGTVRSSDKNPVEAATVSLLRSKDSSLVKISVTSKAGAYEFSRLRSGVYLLRITAVGHRHFFSNPIELGADTSTQSLPDIELQQLPTEIGGVTVAARKPLIENKIDRTVVNVDASTTNTGISALEVLEKSPGVTVDNDGNVSLKGKQGVIILVDGKDISTGVRYTRVYIKRDGRWQVVQFQQTRVTRKPG